MASETTAPSNPPAVDATTPAPSAPPSTINNPDSPGDPSQISLGPPPTVNISLPVDPSQASLSGEAAPVSGSASTPQTGVWFNDPDPQYLIQWSLQEVQVPQLSTPAASQAAPPTTYKACVRIFQEVFETTVATARPVVPFSLRDANTGSLCLQGSLVLLQQPSDPPVLLVKNLKFSGFQQTQVVLFPSVPDAPGGGSSG